METLQYKLEQAVGGQFEIGRNAPRVDAVGKVTGQEKYAADYYPENFVWAGVKRSEHAHAYIKHIDIAAAEQVPGIVAVLTSKDIKGSNRLGIFEKDQPILADDKVRHLGDAVALVIAETQTALSQGLAAVVVEYEPIPTVFAAKDALKQDAPLLHEGRPDGNILLSGEISCGRGAAYLSECDLVAEVTVTVNWQEHAFLETQTGVAWLDEAGLLHMIVSTQTPFRDRLELAEALGISPMKMRVTAPYLGGGFGGKDGVTVQGFLALAAFHSGGRPVKIWYSREESILAGTKRHPGELTYRLGCDKDGYLRALDCRLVFDSGAYSALGGQVLALAMEHAGGPYRIEHTSIQGMAVYTNNPVASAFRGFGVPQATAGIEQAVDELVKLGSFDPLEFRLKNALRRGDTTPAGVVLTSAAGFTECLETVHKHRLWLEREEWEQAAPPFTKRSVGLAACHHCQGFGPSVADYANAKLELKANGTISVYSGVADMGQGNATTCLQIVSHILCQPYEAMELILPDTSLTLPSASSSASRTTFTYGNALIGAAELLKNKLLDRAALILSFQMLTAVKRDDLLLLPGRIVHGASGKGIPIALAASMMDATERVATYSYTCEPAAQIPATGANLRIHGYPHKIFSFAVQLVRIEVDQLTGSVRVCDLLTCVEAGRVLNPQLFEQQIQGGAAQGLGYALFEDFIVKEGKIVTGDFSTYILPTALDLPPMETIVVPLNQDDGPFGMKGVGEIGVNGILPALANAIASITGTRIAGGPLTAEKILLAMEKNRKAGNS
ncbi:MAG: xanthine dehydrogenase, molybdenum binding subunit apoprotein [Firmicutes bacterium]|nr:xanthine dehydrogenase, molybdenum binding subunit apoprotein [Bacillota bacterium]